MRQFTKRLKKHFIKLPPLLLLLSASSCLEYHPKKVETPDVQEWKTVVDEPKNEEYLSDKWWETFQDQKLNDLMQEAIAQSPTVQQAVARLRQANAFYTVTNADRYPQLTLDGYADRRRLSQDILLQQSITADVAGAAGSAVPSTTIAPAGNSPLPLRSNRDAKAAAVAAAGGTPTLKLHRNDLLLTPELKYECDFWGKYAMASKAAYEDIKSSEEALNTALLILTTQVAQTYCELRTFDTQIEIQKALTKSWRAEYELNRSRKTVGISSEIEPETTAISLHQSEVQLEDLKETRAIAENLLGTLVGSAASDFALHPARDALPVPKVPVGLPSTLLAKRPDVRQAEHLIESARQTVGVQRTAYLPTISISGFVGYEGTKFNNLFKWRNHVWDTSASLLGTIFDGWRIAGNVELAKAQYQEQVASFISTVLSAFQEVENSLQSVHTADKSFVFRMKELQNAQTVEELYTAQFKVGIVDYMTVLQAERTSLNAALDETNARLDRLTATVQLIKSIGGSWQRE